MPKVKRSLYQCLQAKVKDGIVYCGKGHQLSYTNLILKLVRGAPLELAVCQECPDYDEMGPPVPKGERGWMMIEKGEEK